MKKLLTLIALATISAHAATNDLVYLQKNSSGKTVERIVTLTPSTFLSVNGSGQLQVQSSSAFLSAIGGATAAQGAKADTALQPGAAATTLNMATARILGRTTAASGAVEELTASQVKTLLAITSSDVSNFTTAVQTVGDARYPQLSGSYSDPAWITALAWSKLSGTPTTLAGYGITDAQAIDPDLTALAALGSSGFSVRTASNTWAQRTIDGTAGQITLTNGAGVSGNPTVSLPTDITQGTKFSSGLAVGSESIPTGGKFAMATTYSGTPAQVLGSKFTLNYTNSIIDTASPSYGIVSYANLINGSGGMLGNPQIIALWGRAYMTSAQTVAGLAGVQGQVYSDGGGTLTNAYAFHAMSPGGGTTPITNSFAFYAQAQARTGVTNAYGVYQAGASDLNYFSGSTTFNLNATVNGNFTAGDAAGDEFVANDDDPRAPNLTSATYTAAADDKVLINGNVGDSKYLARISGDNSTAAMALAIAQAPPLRPGSTWQFANNGTWGNWVAVSNNSWVQLSKQQGSGTAAGWSRAGIYSFLQLSGQSSATIAARGFTFTCYSNFPGDSASIGLATDIYFGAQLTETGGALTSRGLRVRIEGNSPTSNFKVTAAIHDGSSEVSSSANVSAYGSAAFIVRWLPVGGATPGAGSKLEVWGRAEGSSSPSLITTATLSGSIGATGFAGSALAIVASSVGTTPGYTANWEFGGMTIYVH